MAPVRSSVNGEAPTSLAIETDGLRKVFGRTVAVDHLTLTVPRGEVFGYLGPNGAGKTTSVKMLLGLVRPSAGQARLLGRPLGDLAARRAIGFLPEQFRFHEWLKAGEFLDFHGQLYGLPPAERRRRIPEVLALVGLEARTHDRLRTFSKGMMQRIGLAQALMNDPTLVVLDEPTDGVDPVGRKEIRDVLAQLRREGRTVFLNSHLLSEVEMVCNRVAILVQGRVATQGTLEELTRESKRYEIEYAGPDYAWLGEFRGATSRPVAEGQRRIIALPGTDAAAAQPIIDRLRADKAVIHRCQACGESLEDLFIRSVVDPATGKARPPGAADAHTAPSVASPAGSGSAA